MSNLNLRENPRIQRMPKSERDWVHFLNELAFFVPEVTDYSAEAIKILYESNPDTNAFTDNDESKLDGIEDGATGDQTAAEIKVLYEANADTNAFTDADEAKLDGIEANATAEGDFLTWMAL